MSSYKEKIENHPVIYFSGVLLIGFMAGIATYKFIVETSGQIIVPKEKIEMLNNKIDALEKDNNKLQNSHSKINSYEKEKVTSFNITNSKLETNTKSTEQQLNVESQENIVKNVLSIADNKNFSNISFQDFYNYFSDDSIHFLVREDFTKSITAKSVLWEGVISSIQSGNNGSIEIYASPDETTNIATAMLEFDSSQRASLLNKKKGDKIVFNCVISSIYIDIAIMKKCELY